ncbi:ASCH domain-containing protein [Pseudooceanicola aestuarii]|uniref:ASCH domain-containing protein n=1 Tax=Pseudooceanicola aestuarii TaxID=2697319 RepID=UPI001EF83307|nr:ASCH domain-containing protein [Pseudooceanicola aestuarii]
MTDPVTFTFGDSRALCDEVLALVRAGAKTATCARLAEFTEESAPMPVVGRRDIALDWDGAPAVELETREVRLLRFDQMTEAMVRPQAEFRDLAHWQQGYGAYFRRQGLAAPEAEMIVWERFRLLRDFAADGSNGPDETNGTERRS